MADLLERSTLEVLASEDAPSGWSAPRKLTVAMRATGYAEPVVAQVKWKQVPEDGEALNNSPRKELAAYAFQQLLLQESDWVVPPTRLRCLPLTELRPEVSEARAFPGASCSLALVAYWVQGLSTIGVLDEERWIRDAAYRRPLENLDVFTYLIDHRDTRDANFLITTDRARPRLLSVDNGIAFGGLVFNPIAWFQHDWGDLIVPQIHPDLAGRIASLDRQALDPLRVLATFDRDTGALLDSTESPCDAGVCDDGRRLYLGLTVDEIDDVFGRIEELQRQLARGSILVR